MATQVPAIQASGVRLNYPAIVTAAIAGFLLEAGWYSAFYKLWLEGIGTRTDRVAQADLAQPRAPVLDCPGVHSSGCRGGLLRGPDETGRQTLLRGIWVGALLGLGLVLPIFGLEYIFEVRTIELLLINAGFWIVGMMLMEQCQECGRRRCE